MTENTMTLTALLEKTGEDNFLRTKASLDRRGFNPQGGRVGQGHGPVRRLEIIGV